MMIILSSKDIVPIMAVTITFTIISMLHRILLPNKYSAFLQFKSVEDPQKNIASICIRILYLFLGTIFFYRMLGYTIKQICAGIFLHSFLNIWPALIQLQLFKYNKTKKEWALLGGYIFFIVWSVATGCFSVIVLEWEKISANQTVWFESPIVTVILSLLSIIVPGYLEFILTKISYVAVPQNLNTYFEELYLVHYRISMEKSLVDKYHYTIDETAKKMDINPILLRTILSLEICYRNRLYNRIIEKFMCSKLKKLAIKKDISVGLAQIKISTATSLVQKDAEKILDFLTDDYYNIDLCGRYLRSLIERFDNWSQERKDSELDMEDVYTYIAHEYSGGNYYLRPQSSLVYSSVLRTVMKDKVLNYFPTDLNMFGNLSLDIRNKDFISYDEYKMILQDFNELTGFREPIAYDEKGYATFKISCSSEYNLEKVQAIIHKYNLNYKILPFSLEREFV